MSSPSSWSHLPDTGIILDETGDKVIVTQEDETPTFTDAHPTISKVPLAEKTSMLFSLGKTTVTIQPQPTFQQPSAQQPQQPLSIRRPIKKNHESGPQSNANYQRKISAGRRRRRNGQRTQHPQRQ